MKASADPIRVMTEAMAERTRMNLELMERLAEFVAASERAQRRFRTAVLIRLSTIEAMAAMIHAAQIGEPLRDKPNYEQKLAEETKAAHEFISEQSRELGLAMFKYVNEEPEASLGRDKEARERSV